MWFTEPISQGSHKYVAIFSPSYQSTTTSFSRYPSCLVDSTSVNGTSLREAGLASLIAFISCIAVEYTTVGRNALSVCFSSCVD